MSKKQREAPPSPTSGANSFTVGEARRRQFDRDSNPWVRGGAQRRPAQPILPQEPIALPLARRVGANSIGIRTPGFVPERSGERRSQSYLRTQQPWRLRDFGAKVQSGRHLGIVDGRQDAGPHGEYQPGGARRQTRCVLNFGEEIVVSQKETFDRTVKDDHFDLLVTFDRGNGLVELWNSVRAKDVKRRMINRYTPVVE
jgi:hypothetical protein